MQAQSFFKNKKILITGHTGFKGAWLSKLLIDWGAKVTGLSLLPNTQPNLFEILNIKEKISNYFLDIRDFEKLTKILKKEQPEIVFHLAAQPLVRDSYDDPIKTFSTNIMGTANVMESARIAGGVKALLIITTDKVYQNNEWVYPYRETDQLGGHDPYSASKAAADIVAQSFAKSFFPLDQFKKTHSTLVAIARAGNVIGGGDWSKDRLIPDIIRGVFEKKETILVRNPQSIRPWQHVFESLAGYLKLAAYLFEEKVDFSGSWNFGPNEESFISVEQIINQAKNNLLELKYQIVSDISKHEANFLKLDISKAKTYLDWHPKLSINQALEWTFNWYQAYYTHPKEINALTNQQIKNFFKEGI